MAPEPRPGPADEELFERFRRGDARAFEDLMKRYQAPLFHFILRFVRNRDTAQELLQDSWLRILHGASEFQRASKFSTWAYTVARNLCIDHARKQVHRKHPSLEQPTGGEEGPTLGEQLRDPAPATDRKAVSSELQRSLMEAIEALPEEQREVFLMREYSDLPFKEIAQIVGAPENTVKSRMRYALERLQTALAEYEDLARALG